MLYTILTTSTYFVVVQFGRWKGVQIHIINKWNKKFSTIYIKLNEVVYSTLYWIVNEG